MPARILVLIADRDADSRLMYAEYLRQLRYDVEEAEDGREALAKALAQLPGIIVTETRLPGISGLDLCRLLRGDASTKATPIVVVTADGQEDTVRLAKVAGADAVLVKPCLPVRLGAEIEAVLRLSRELRRRATAARDGADGQLAKSKALLERSHSRKRDPMMSDSSAHRDTSTPSVVPPALRCPACDAALLYLQSHVGGVSARHREQWDYLACSRCARTFEYRQRTRKLRACPASMVQALKK
jgi:two-component system, OmpR family, phosphate regulon response regulator PhoB